MTGPEPLLVRLGKGDPSLFVEEEPAYAWCFSWAGAKILS